MSTLENGDTVNYLIVGEPSLELRPSPVAVAFVFMEVFSGLKYVKHAFVKHHGVVLGDC